MIHPLASITLLKFLSDETGFHRFDPGFADVLLTCGVAACGGGGGGEFGRVEGRAEMRRVQGGNVDVSLMYQIAESFNRV